MRSQSNQYEQIARIIERLMDADVLFPEEGDALLREIEAENWTGGAEGPKNPQAQSILEALESLAQTDCTGDSARQAVLEAVRALLHPLSSSTPPSPESNI